MIETLLIVIFFILVVAALAHAHSYRVGFHDGECEGWRGARHIVQDTHQKLTSEQPLTTNRES
jgi:hypothetical protein